MATMGASVSFGQPHMVMSSSNIPATGTLLDPANRNSALVPWAMKVKQISSQPLAPLFVAVQVSSSQAPPATVIWQSAEGVPVFLAYQMTMV